MDDSSPSHISHMAIIGDLTPFQMDLYVTYLIWAPFRDLFQVVFCFSKVWKFPDSKSGESLKASLENYPWKKGSPEQFTVHHHSPCKISEDVWGVPHFQTQKKIYPTWNPHFPQWNPHVWWLTATKLLKRAAHVTIWERYALAGREFCAGGLPAARHSVHDRMIEWIELYETNQLVGDIRDPSALLRCISDMYLPG